MRNILIVILFFAPVLLVAQQIQQDTLTSDIPQKKRIRILNSDRTLTIESDSGSVSRFRHNIKMEHEGVLMECDSAVMYNGIFEAFGNTKVTSGTTVVTGDMMIYNEFTSKAKVSGRIVYLTDGSSTLRTTEVDFNTETETGYFENEGTIVDSFRILESKRGYYYSKTKVFEFIGQVQADTKDYVLQSDSMIYNTLTKVFTFHSNTHIWSENGYLYCDKGWYDSDKDIMFFYSNSYMLSAKQEIFADSIYYENNGKKGHLYSNVQVTDTAQKTTALADLADFDMNIENFLMRRNPSIIMYNDEDSVFIRADTLYSVTQTVKIPVSKKDSVRSTISNEFSFSDTTFAASVSDSVSSDITKYVSDTTFAASVLDSVSSDTTKYVSDTTFAASVLDSISSDTTKYVSDTTFAASVLDSVSSDTTKYVSDTVEYVDSTYKEMFAVRNAKLYRSDFQLKSDSIYFNTVDSIWKIYYDPILWDGKKMQITSDSMKFYIRNGELEHADFNGTAMLVVPEGNPDSTVYFNQIKSKNMKAHLRNGSLNLFEAAGNVQTIAFSMNNYTMNKAESSSFKIFFESGKARCIAYYDQVTGKNDSFLHIREDEIKLPGYRWEIDLRPASGSEVINRLLRPSERTFRESLIKPSFPITKRIDEIELKMNKQVLK